MPDASRAVCAHLEAFLLEVEPALVLAYRAFGGEVSLEELQARLAGVRWATTRANEGGRLSLHPWGSAVERGRLGVLEPGPDAPTLAPADVDVALVPGLAFDERGGRLGYGRGYYDRLLPALRPGTPILGVTRDALVVPALPLTDLDFPVTHLATESGVRRVR